MHRVKNQDGKFIIDEYFIFQINKMMEFNIDSIELDGHDVRFSNIEHNVDGDIIVVKVG